MDAYRVAIIEDPNEIEVTINRYADQGMELHTILPFPGGGTRRAHWIIVMQPIMVVESELVEPEFPDLRQCGMTSPA